MDPLIISALLGAAGSIFGKPKAQVDPVSKILAGFLKQYGPEALLSLAQDAFAKGYSQDTLAQMAQEKLQGQQTLNTSLPQVLQSTSAAGFDSRGNMQDRVVSAVTAANNADTMQAVRQYGLDDLARKDQKLNMLLSFLTGGAGQAAQGYQNAYARQSQQQSDLMSGIGNVAMGLASRPANPAAPIYYPGNPQYGSVGSVMGGGTGIFAFDQPRPVDNSMWQSNMTPQQNSTNKGLGVFADLLK